MIADITRRKFIIAGVIVAVFLIGFGSFIAGRSSNKTGNNPKAVPPKAPTSKIVHSRPPIPKVNHSKGPTPKGMIATYPLVKLAEVSGRISGLGENDTITIYIGGKWKHPSAKSVGYEFTQGNGKWNRNFSVRIEVGEEPENFKIEVHPKHVPKELKSSPESYKFSISRGQKIEDVNFRFVK